MMGLRRIGRGSVGLGFGRNRIVCAVLFVHDLWPWTYFERCLHPPQGRVQRCLAGSFEQARFHQKGSFWLGLD